MRTPPEGTSLRPSRRFIPLLAVLTGVSALVAPAHSQANVEVSYDWMTGGRTAPSLHAGQHVSFEVRNFNPLCYSVSITAEAVNIAVNVTEFTRIFTPESPTEERGQANETSSGPTISGVRVLSSTERAAVEWMLRQAATSLSFAQAISADAGYVVKSMSEPDCTSNRGTDLGHVLVRWRALRVSFDGQPIARASDLLREARAYVDTSLAKLVNTQQVDDLRLRADSLNLLINRVAAELPDARLLASAGARAEALDAEVSRARYQLVLGHEAERVKVTIRSTPVAGSNAPQVPERVDELVVRRRHRVFLSTGVLVSGVDQRHYEQVRRQATVDGVPIPDSSYVTYATKTRGRFSTISPAVQLNVSLTDEPVSLLLSFGATTRSVNESQGVEPFLGISFAVLDRLVVTWGGHWGRREELLLGRPQDVESRPVPTGITRSDAVGTRFVMNQFLSISIRP